MPVDAKSDIRLRFFDLLFGAEEGYLCIATTSSSAPKATFAQRFYEWPNESMKVENFILSVEQQHNVYFCVNLLKEPVRKKEQCLPTNLVWADLDGVHPEDLLKIPPPIVIRSSEEKWQALWRMTVPVPPYQAEDYSHRMAYLIGADHSGWDLTQLLRVPCTFNFKYDPPPYIELERLLETQAPPLIFESLPVTNNSDTYSEVPLPKIDLEAGHILYRYKGIITPAFESLMTMEPADDWSSVLWRLIHECIRVGMTKEEIFVVTKEAKCNKYVRDGRPLDHLWRDILKAWDSSSQKVKDEFLVMPLLAEMESTPTLVDEYREWATMATDAIPDFHNLCILTGLSAIISNSVKLKTSFGDVTPNIWGLLLGKSTITRKTTAMRLVMDFLLGMDKELLVATEATAEGLLMGVAERPNKTSIFHRDEISGMFASMTKREYMTGFQEVLTALYDAPPVLVKKLSKSVVTIDSPKFVILGGGVPSRIYESVDESFILSGFLPRFLVSYGEANIEDLKPIGPPVEESLHIRASVFNKLADLYETYGVEVETKIGGQKVMMPQRFIAKLTPDAWKLWNKNDQLLLNTANDSKMLSDLALPTFDRLSKSALKIAVILGAIRQKPKAGQVTIEEQDVINSTHYIQPWGENAIKMMTSAGKGIKEGQLERVFAAILSDPGIWRSELMTRFHLIAKEADQLFATLEERGMIRKERLGKGTAYWAVI